MSGPLTTGAIAKLYGIETWMVRRVFELGMLPAPHRVGIYRVFSAEDLPAIEAALKARGYLKAETAVG